MTVLLAVAYALVAALLLHLGIASAWRPAVKIGAIAVVTAFYGATYLGLRALEGWPTGEPLPERFGLQWVVVDDPDKASGEPGVIHFWVRELDETGREGPTPRAHALPWDEATARKAREAQAALQGGQRLEGRLTRGTIDPAEGESEQRADADDPAGAGSLGDDARSRFEFREVPPPELPPKPAL